MDLNEKYQYKFQYSLAHYQPLCHDETEDDNDFSQRDEQTVLRRSNELIDYRCFSNPNTEQIIKTLFTHFIQLYGRVAVRLFRICEKIYQNLEMSSSSFIRNFQEIIDHERQKLVENLSELSQIFYDQKDKYFKLIALSVSSSIFKILTIQKEIEDLEFETVFHTVYWEMTGSHSTSQILKKLIGETFNVINFHKYLINEESAKVYKPKPVAQSLVRNSTSFVSNSYSNASMSFSIKDMVMKSVKEPEKEKEAISFSKQIKRKQKLTRQFSSPTLNENESGQKLNRNKIEISHKQNMKTENSEPRAIQECKSNEKAFNFKKDRVGIFQNYTKSKSGKKLFSEFGSSSKKPTFANYLQHKKLYF